jgi:hypothetical protein
MCIKIEYEIFINMNFSHKTTTAIKEEEQHKSNYHDYQQPPILRNRQLNCEIHISKHQHFINFSTVCSRFL